MKRARTTTKKQALEAISKLPNHADMDDIMYRLYVLDTIKKGQEAAKKGQVVSVENLLKAIKSW